MRADIRDLVNTLEREARGKPGVIHIGQLNSLRQGPISQLGIVCGGRQPSQKNGVLDATPGAPGSTAAGWVTPKTPTGGWVSFRSLLDAVIRGNPALSYPSAFTFARSLVRPAIFSRGRLDGASLSKEFQALEPKPAAH